MSFFDNISYTIYIRVLKLGQKVALAESFKMICLRVTLTEGEGHMITLKCGNGDFFAVFVLEYLWHFLQ